MDHESVVLISISTVGGRQFGPHLEYGPRRKPSLSEAILTGGLAGARYLELGLIPQGAIVKTQ